MSLNIEYGDITKYKVDAIVIPANPEAKVGNGVDKKYISWLVEIDCSRKENK